MKTDAEVKRDVLAELNWTPAVNATDIGVEVKDGIVTLSGHLASYAEKWEAERAAQRVSGVKALAIEMDVTLPGSSKRSDSDIARAVENALEWTVNWPKDCVKVMVEGGWITLSGELTWDYQRQAVARAVRYLLGVTGVSNQIVIKPAISSSRVKSDIEDALKRQAIAEAKGIRVDVQGKEVTLSGTAHNWAERARINRAAWGTTGVQNVVSNITLAY